MSTPMRIMAASGSERLVPGDGETHRRIDQADHAVGLREVAPQLARRRLDVLREQAVLVAARDQRLEQRARLLRAPERRQRVDVPEGAYRERVLGHAEIVGLAVA